MDTETHVVLLEVWKGEALSDSIVDERFQWLLAHLAAPNGAQGRQVCPWAVQALRNGKFLIGDARKSLPDVSGISTVVEYLVREYQFRSKFDPTNRVPETLTVLISDSVTSDTIVRVLEIYRPRLTPLGLMLGALDPFNSLLSLSGGRGCPYSAPWNFLTIRWMVPGDWIFLNLNPAYKEIYVKFFGTWPESSH